ncbi:MAG: sulfatase-like hydrolase/transferase [Chitinophagales bacterium]
MRNFHFLPAEVFYCLLSLVLVTGNPSDTFAQPCALPKPTNVKTSGITACQVKLSWNAVTGAAYYGVKFKPKDAAIWSEVKNVGLNTAFTFMGLDPAVTYKFAVTNYCANNKNSGFIITKSTTAACTAPLVSGVQIVSPDAVAIDWDQNGCVSSYNQIRYKKTIDVTWTYVFTGSNSGITLQNLLAGASYSFQVTHCADTLGSWSAPGSFQLPGRPNILMIILDDARYDSYSCNGGPSFFNSPNIDRIANEGVNFKSNFCVQSYCIPSRGTIVTGLYPHKHGATNNSKNIYEYLPTTAKILDSAGYYTGWIGKYHMAVKPQPGYDYWFATKVNSGTDEYHNLKYNWNGTLATVNGHDTDIVTDSTLAFLDKNADKAFFVTVGYHAPHNPFIPQDPYIDLYESEEMPVPSNTKHYKSNFPSFLYKLPENYYLDPDDIAAEYQPYYEMLAGIDVAVGEILQKLTDLSLLDKTLVIFTSDNGALFGEHGLSLKRFAYEPSSRVPLFIRYPAWFANETIVTDQLSLNVDIAPTILEAAGINGSYSFDGLSLRKLADGDATRTSMYFESVFDSFTVVLPSLRSVRTLDAKLVQYGCDHITEEFFNLATDIGEDTNQIKNAAYSGAIQNLRDQLNNFKLQLNDTMQENILNCFLKAGVQKNANLVSPDVEDIPWIEDNVLIYPQPAKEAIMVSFLSDIEDPQAEINITDEWGIALQAENIHVVAGENVHPVALKELYPGYYLITIRVKNRVITKPLILIQ